MAIETKSKFGIDITKQGIEQRFNESARKFIQVLIDDVLTRQISKSIDIEWLDYFQRVIIKDSTRFDVNPRVKDKLPGFGGSASDAGACIQYEFDIKTGHINDLSIAPANSSDTKNALSTIGTVRKGDLTIRDLGYFSVDFFKPIGINEAFFLSRLNAKIGVYQKEERKYKALDFGEIYWNMKENDIPIQDMNVCIGKDDKYPVRLIVEPVCEEVFLSRMKKIERYNKSKGHQTSQDYRDRCRLNLFITNVPQDIITKQNIAILYKLRWQIELIFKIWKSVFGLDKLTPMKYDRLITTLNARLLVILINWEAVMIQRAVLFKKNNKLLSLNKCFKTLKDNGLKLRNMLSNKRNGIEQWLRWINNTVGSKHWLEKRKNKLGFEEIIMLNI